MTTSSDYVSVSHVSFEYEEGKPVLSDVTFGVRPGEMVCILGPSGCGKSTLLGVLSGLLPPLTGEVRVGDHALHAASNGTRGPRLGFVFQEPRLLPWRTIYDNISFALSAAGVPKQRHAGTISKYLRLLRIEELRDSWPLNVSGGQRQRAAIARALAIDPLYVLMDEPFSNLDEVTARALRQELLAVWQDTQTTVIFVTHSAREAVFLADRIFIMTANPGRLHSVVAVDLERPRSYLDVRLAETEAAIVSSVIEIWKTD
ncbi:MAG: ABC transporter ATP-binding protein [Candidatus Acidiferrales bacterium]